MSLVDPLFRRRGLKLILSICSDGIWEGPLRKECS